LAVIPDRDPGRNDDKTEKLIFYKFIKSGYPQRKSGIECGSGFQPRQLVSRLEAAPTESFSNSKLGFVANQEIKIP
jgi:hypothetical protein